MNFLESLYLKYCDFLHEDFCFFLFLLSIALSPFFFFKSFCDFLKK